MIPRTPVESFLKSSVADVVQFNTLAIQENTAELEEGSKNKTLIKAEDKAGKHHRSRSDFDLRLRRTVALPDRLGPAQVKSCHVG